MNSQRRGGRGSRRVGEWRVCAGRGALTLARQVLRCGLVLACALGFALAAAAEASADVYWTHSPSGSTSDGIGRANPDGTGVNQNFITTNGPQGVAVDGSYVYWTNPYSNTIARANLDGSGVNQSFITGAETPMQVAVDGTHVYWTNFNSTMSGQADTIGRANLDGTGVNNSFIPTQDGVGVAVDGAHVYWANARTHSPGQGDTIGRANLDGTGVNQSFITTSYPHGVAVDSGHVYWSTGHNVGRANLDGTGVNQSFITPNGTDFPLEVAVDGGHVYWSSVSNDNSDTIGRANLDGTGVSQSFITGIQNPYGVAVTRGSSPSVTSVSPASGPASGGSSVTVRGSGFTGATAVAFAYSDSGSTHEVAAGSFNVVDDGTITAVSPDLGAGAAADENGQGVLLTDVIVTAGGLSSAVSPPGDSFSADCSQDSNVADGAWAVSGCFVQPDPNNYDGTQESSLDGLVVSPDPGASSDYDTGGSAAVSTKGSATLSLDTTAISASASRRLVPLLKGAVKLALSGGPQTISLPAGFKLAGMPLSGSLTLTPGANGTVTGTGFGTLPDILGGGTAARAKVTFTSSLGSGLTSLHADAVSGSFAKLFRLDALRLDYKGGTWTVNAKATGAGGAAQLLTGTLAYNSADTLTAGTLNISGIELAGVLSIKKFAVSYSLANGWAGSATITQGKQGASVDLRFDAQGLLKAGSFKARQVHLFRVLALKTFDMTYDTASDTWTLAVEANIKGAKQTTASLKVVNGMVEGANFHIKDVRFANALKIIDLNLSYTSKGGHTVYDGAVDVELAGMANRFGKVVHGIRGSMVFTDGHFTKGSLHLRGNIPVFEFAFLNEIGADIELKPMHEIAGTVGLSAGPEVRNKTLLGVKGKLTYTYPAGKTAASYAINVSEFQAVGIDLGTGSMIFHDGTAKLKADLGKGGNGLHLGRFVDLTGTLTGTITKRLIRLDGKDKLEVKISGKTYTLKVDTALNNRGVAACGTAPGIKSPVGFTMDWGHAPALATHDCSLVGY